MLDNKAGETSASQNYTLGLHACDLLDIESVNIYTQKSEKHPKALWGIEFTMLL